MAMRVDTRMLTFSHRKSMAIAITRINTVDLMTLLFLRIFLDVFPPDARLSNAPK